jgi:hypothetical protein
MEVSFSVWKVSLVSTCDPTNTLEKNNVSI